MQHRGRLGPVGGGCEAADKPGGQGRGVGRPGSEERDGLDVGVDCFSAGFEACGVDEDGGEEEGGELLGDVGGQEEGDVRGAAATGCNDAWGGGGVEVLVVVVVDDDCDVGGLWGRREGGTKTVVVDEGKGG